MKKIILTFLLVVSANSSLLLGDNRKTASLSEDFLFQNNQRAEITKNYELPTANCNNQGVGLDCYLMMNPSVEDGMDRLGEDLGVFGKRTIAAEATAAERASSGVGRSEVVSAISSSNVLRLRGGGPKKSQPMGALKSTGASSDEEDAVPDLESEDTQAMGSEVSKYLKKEIINNIYEECLAEVANMSLGASGSRITGESMSKESAEWNAAEKAAEYSKGKVERAFEKAEREIDEAKGISDEAKRNLRELEKAPKPANAEEQAIAVAALAYEKAYAAHAASDYKAKKLAGELAEARVETANAVLHAITVRKSTQHASAAEAGLETAKEAEAEALEAVEAAKTDVAAKAALMSSAEANLNEAKRKVIGTSGINPAPPMTAAQRVAMREVEEDKAIAEVAKNRAKKVELKANVAKGKIHEMNFERELKAYHDAEEVWMEAGEGYKTALAKVHEVGLDDEELTAALASAEVHQATWRAHARWVKARQADQAIEKEGTSLDHLVAAQVAWAHAVEGYKMAITKATEANLKGEELTISLENVRRGQDKVTHAKEEHERLCLYAKEQAILASEQAKNYLEQSIQDIAQARSVKGPASDSKGLQACYYQEISYCWLRVIEFLAQGNQAIADLWKQAAEQKRVEELYYLSSVAEWVTKAAKARESNNQESVDLWMRAAEQMKTTYAEASRTSSQEGDCYVINPLWWSADRLSEAAASVDKAFEEKIQGNLEIAALRIKGALAMRSLAEQWKQYDQDRSITRVSWSNWQILGFAAHHLSNDTQYLIQTTEKNLVNQEINLVNQEMSIFWMNSAKQSKFVVEHLISLRSLTSIMTGQLTFGRRMIDDGQDAGLRWDIMVHCFQKKAYYLFMASEWLTKAVEAKHQGDIKSATLWRRAVEKLYMDLEQVTPITTKNYVDMNRIWDDFNDIYGNYYDGRCSGSGYRMSREAFCLFHAAECLNKSRKTESKGNLECANLWKKLAEKYEGETEKDVAENSGQLAKATQALDEVTALLAKALEAEKNGNRDIAVLWRKSASQNQMAVTYYLMAVEANVLGNKTEADRYRGAWEIIGVAPSTQSAADQFARAAICLKKAIEEEKNGNQDRAVLWEKAAEQNQIAAEHYQRTAKASKQGNEQERTTSKKAANEAEKAAAMIEEQAEELALKSELLTSAR